MLCKYVFEFEIGTGGVFFFEQMFCSVNERQTSRSFTAYRNNQFLKKCNSMFLFENQNTLISCPLE